MNRPRWSLSLRSLRSAWVTIGSLIAMAAGLLCGIAISRSPDGRFASAIAAIEPIGRMWMAVLWITVLPLLFAMIVLAVASTRSSIIAGRLGVLSILTAVSMIGTGLITSILIARTVIATWPLDMMTRAALRAQVAATEAGMAHSSQDAAGLWSRLSATAFIRSAAGGNLVALLAGAAIIGLIVTAIPSRPREAIIRGFQIGYDAMLVVVTAILHFTPVAVFSMTTEFASRAGLQAAGAMGYLLAMGVGLLLLYAAACYPLAALAGTFSLRQFARAAFPAQVMGVAARSSVAAVPQLLDGCERVLQLPGVVARFVLPMMVTVFKLARMMGVGKLLVLAHFYGVELGAFDLVTFVLLETAAGSTPGMPQTGVLTAPAYIAVGIPLEGVLLFNAAEAVIDLPKTFLNVTGAMTAVTIVARLAGKSTVLSTMPSLGDPVIAPAAPAQ